MDGRGALPPTLRDALMLRIERLSEDAQELLRLLAAGRRLDHQILADASGADSRVLREALREAVAAQLVVPDEEGFYAFRHALLREVVVDDLLPGERAELHLALARALERRAEGLPDHGGAHLAAGIAYHYLESGDQPAALAASVRAAEAAAVVHANGEAAALYSRALKLWDRVAGAEELTGLDHVELLRATAWATFREHDPARAETLLRAALAEVDDPVRTARLLEMLARAQFDQGRSADAAETRHGALDLLPDEPSETRAMLLASLTKDLMMESRYSEAVDAAKVALEVAQAAGDEISQIRALDAMGVSLFGLARFDEGERALREAMRRSEEGGHLHTAPIASEPRGVAGGGGPARGGARDRRRGLREAERARLPAPLAGADALRARVRGRRLGRGRAPAAVAGAARDGHDVRQRGAAADRARARARRSRAGAHDPRPGRATSPPNRASRSGSGRWARCGPSSSGAAGTWTRRGPRSRTRSTGSTSARRTWRGCRGSRPRACASRPTPPCGRAISARTRRSRSRWPRG